MIFIIVVARCSSRVDMHLREQESYVPFKHLYHRDCLLRQSHIKRLPRINELIQDRSVKCFRSSRTALWSDKVLRASFAWVNLNRENQ